MHQSKGGGMTWMEISLTEVTQLRARMEVTQMEGWRGGFGGVRLCHLLAVGDLVLPDPTLLPQWHCPGQDQAGGRPSIQAHRCHPGGLCRGDT